VHVSIDFASLVAPYRVTSGRGFRLAAIDPGDSGPFDSDERKDAKELLTGGLERLRDLQERLYAQDRWAVLLVFQAMDAAGKDGTIKHVMSGVNPQGCQVYSFKQPSAEELDHDFLWRAAVRLPERGRIGVFNRSYYEETLVVRVHPEILESQKLPPRLVGKTIWRERFESIRDFERHLARSGTLVLKFFLHVSKEEQRRRFLDRLERPEKNWKFSVDDVRERGHWKDYRHAYEEAIRETSAPGAPWFVVPADHKWYTRVVVAAAIVEAMETLGLEYPRVQPARRKHLAAARRALLAEGRAKRGRRRTR
jgi:PPK2 family polyphosphate:nucleotide phosphotransferase